MPITEVVFPVFKLDPETLATLQAAAPTMFSTIKGVPGLLNLLRGPLLEENGQAVDPSTHRSVLSLEWENVESFHGFYPSSDAFLGFFNVVKPLVAAAPSPQLFQAENRSTDCLSSNLTQIIKGQAASGTAETWKKIQQLLGANIPSYQAGGIEKDAAEFLGLIGWKSKEEYEQFGKQKEFLELVKQLNAQNEVDNILVQLTKIDT
ncbi:uncharacterized protein TrAtP1_005114 [Trichoderma atroviride]|uniref:ABM domain-containing protein n=1 Tax=Hypocrea atroviridis (strain ATCC 20476 / IMI 206040) TaxID=452589 RepID=G9P7L5_HYPAI|nr:uncharacterized protein TRIATDRAFT_302080 [Trichoderma atroviride IMI 206040]EHK41607.1 hypothetical protein TRIATDRAFT_302080 [Trichoderma atroviride IMI 206040]UKZ63892.1 hypothetical protein TrAtP1_005114 [Trichoderma atroviride]